MRRREPLSPDMTPLVDVVFLLLIFFLVSTAFKKDQLALLLNLPSSEAPVEMVKKEEVNIELSSEKIALKGKEITFEQLDTSLSRVKNKKSPINVRIDKEVRYERIIKLFDLLKKYDLNNLALINESAK
ncbi:biopolymer transporter ExbD [Sulfurimonas lithotrophica]|uniref:Biopolymer transporter ExbD n=1 Tax=Sulfurimonas lithotrophica TaxID=2590022 RepID=A0A5P8P2R3_9BACT|nr:biopolymer transporter ExbD [Sulfurimonas lithotrophica]QFR49999.1 biopolymer transporter ExbD [Sulfurimonas lithotrophica]